MAACNIDDLMADAKCFYGLPPNVLAVLATQLWCDISGGITPPGGGNVWFNPDVGSPINNPDVGVPITNPDI